MSLPGTLPPPATGDPALDAEVAGLDRPLTEAREVADRVRRLAADARPALVEALLTRLEAMAGDPPPLTGYAAVAKAWQQRGWVAQNHLQALEPRIDDAVRRRLAATLDARFDPQIRPRIADLLLRTLPVGKHPLLQALSAHLVAGNPLAPFAAEARLRVEGAAARPAIVEALRSGDDYTRTQLAARVAARVDFDADPDWVDALCAGVLDLQGALPLFGRLLESKRPEPLRRALRFTKSKAIRTDLQDRLKDLSGPLIEDAVGTDGGPILVLPAEAASAWNADYDRACAAMKKGSIEIGGRTALVLPLPAVGVAIVDGDILLVLVGGPTDLERALKKKSGWKRRTQTLSVGAGGLLLLDAAVTAAQAGPEASKVLAVPAGEYSVAEITSPVHVIRLRETSSREGTTPHEGS